jgi:RNA polymerase sigma-70 factor (ECF subfamily)
MPDKPLFRTTNQFLLESTQEYLRRLVNHQTPDSLLAAAWDQFYHVYSELVRRFVGSRGLHGADADDCVQEVWSDVIVRLTEFQRPEGRPGLRAWLYTIVRSRAIDVLRRNARESPGEMTRGPSDSATAAAEPVDPEWSTSSAYEREWKTALVRTLAEELKREVSERNARLLQMRLVEGRDVATVAAALGLTPEQVWYRQHRLLKKLRARAAVFVGGELGGNGE